MISDALVLLVALPPLVGMFVFAVLWLHALDEQFKAEVERDDLWDSVYAVTCRGDEDCIAGYNHDGPHRYPSWDNR